MSGSSSGSVEPDASTSQPRAAHDTVKAAAGGSAPTSSPACTTTENIRSRLAAALVVAVRPAAVPDGTAAAESPSTELTLPLPVVAAEVRAVTPAGVLQVDVVDDFSLQ